MTEAIYEEVSAKTEKATVQHRRISVCGMLKYLDVSRSGYRFWLCRKPSRQEQRRKAVKLRIKQKHAESKKIYGAPKITQELRKEGEKISERTVGKYMRDMGIKAVWSKHWTVTTKDSDFSHRLHNYLGEHFNPERPNAVWCTDITYIWTYDGFVYLTSIMDLFSRKIIAWTLSRTMEVKSAVVETFATNTDTVLLHSATASGLLAGTTYYYRLGSEGDWSEPQQFTTEADKPKAVKFLVFGDSQSGKASNPEYGPWGKTIKNAYAANPDAAFFMNVGDLVEIGYDYAHWKNWYTAAQDVIEKLPAMAVPGNHETYDVADESHSSLPIYFTKQLHLPMNGPKELAGQVYSFDYGNAHFAVLDSQEEEEGAYVASMLEKEAAWLARDLAATKQPWKLVFFHRTPYYNKATRSNENVKKAFAGVIDQYHVDLVINGHDHGYSRTYPIYQDAFVDSPSKGTVYLVTGRSGNKYYTDLSNKVWDAFFHDPQAEPNYVVIETEGDILTVRGVTQSGDLIDTYRIDKKKGIDTPQTSLPERCQQTLMAVWGDLLQTPLLDVPPQEIEGSWYVPLESLLDFAGGTFAKMQGDQVQAVYKKTTALLQKDAAKAMVNGQEHPLQHPLRSYHGASLLSTADVQQIFGFNSKYDAALNILFLVR